jgi:hypothetical protein
MTVAAAINPGVQWRQSQQNSLQGKDLINYYYLLSESGWHVDAY